MLNISKENYDYYKSIFKIIWTFQSNLSGMDPNADISPINVLKEWEQKSMSIARRGLKAGLLDALQMLSDLPRELKDQLNGNLTDENFPSFDSLTSVVKDIPAKVLKRGRIKNLDEYYIIKEVVSDMSYDIPNEDRQMLNDLYFHFERHLCEEGKTTANSGG